MNSTSALHESPFELAIFDVDGTLNGIELWWPDLIRKGVQDFAEAEGLKLTSPDDRQALEVVGNADAEVWSPFLPLDQQHRWDDLRAMVLPMEVELLRSGRDFLYPGVVETLTGLRRAGLRLALASNCGAEYMAAIAEGQGLASLTDWQFCLDSEGVETKTDMLRAAMDRAGTRRAVMVGDRAGDQRAAIEAGIPFVWRINDLCELSDVQGRWEGDPGELMALFGHSRISFEGRE